MNFKSLVLLICISLISGCANKNITSSNATDIKKDELFGVEKKSSYVLCSECRKRTEKVLDLDEVVEAVDIPVVSKIETNNNLIAEKSIETKTYVMHFDFDKSIATKGELARLGQFLKDVDKENKLFLVTVTGNADPRGKIGYNKSLSRKRASYVSSLLIKSGIEQEKIKTKIEEPCCIGNKHDAENIQSEKRRATIIIEVRA